MLANFLAGFRGIMVIPLEALEIVTTDFRAGCIMVRGVCVMLLLSEKFSHEEQLFCLSGGFCLLFLIFAYRQPMVANSGRIFINDIACSCGL